MPFDLKLLTVLAQTRPEQELLSSLSLFLEQDKSPESTEQYSLVWNKNLT